MKQEPINSGSSEKGAILVLVAVGMVAILGLAALAIDLGYLYLVDNQLQVAADSAALGGAAKIVSDTDCTSTSPSPTNNYAARTEAQTFAGFNKAGSKVGQTGVVLDLNATSNAYVADGVFDDSDGDIVLGNFTRDRVSGDPTQNFRPCQSGGTPVNAVRVHARRNSDTGTGIDSSDPSNDPAPIFFASVLGFDESGVKAFATAISGVRGDIPVCIPSCFVDNLACSGSSTSPIELRWQPDPAENAVWTSFQNSPPNKNTVIPFIDGTEEIPCIGLQGQINLTNGNVMPIWRALDDAVNDDPGPADGPGITVSEASPLRAILPVCQYDCQPAPDQCKVEKQYGSGPGDPLPVVGSAVFNIISVNSETNPRNIRGYFFPVGSAGPRCSGLVE